jgi:ribonuclease J
MKANVGIAQELGYLKFHRGTRVSIEKASDLPPEKVVVICTGAQGEGNASLMRIAQKEHHHISLSDNDIVVFSSSIVPGNERTVQSLKDLLFRQGAKVIDYQMMDIHAGGHAKSEDLKMTVNLTKPKFFIPIQGNYYMLRMHADMVKEMGWDEDRVALLGNGDRARVSKDSLEVTKEQASSSYIFVDGLGVGDVGNIVLRDRQKMSEDGMFVLIARIDSESGELYGPAEEIDIISRGFVYLNESKELLNDTREKIEEIIGKEATEDQTTNWSYLKDVLRDKIGQFLFQETQRRPLVLPVIIEV